MKNIEDKHLITMFSSPIEVIAQKGVKMSVIKRVRTDLDEAVKNQNKKEVDRLQRILRDLLND